MSCKYIIFFISILGFNWGWSQNLVPNSSFEDTPLTEKNNWQLIQDTLYAVGGEQYMTIGNFMPDSLSDTLFLGDGRFFANYSYYYIDSVSVLDAGSMGVEDFAKKENIKVYPNPVSDIVHVETKASNGGELFITDLFGNVIEEKTFPGSATSVSTIGLKTGIYFIRVQTSAGVITRKIVVQH